MVIRTTFRINGETRTVEVEPHTTLLTVIRDNLELTGTKKGCLEGECGACTVLLDGKAVNSCLVLAAEVDGREVTTIEGLETEGGLDPVQEAFIEHGSSQCGFCTPGMVLTVRGLLNEIDSPTEEDIKWAISGNICRCTGYKKIIAAALSATCKK
jgi:carbon-monoxide dehydrogenase small subunit